MEKKENEKKQEKELKKEAIISLKDKWNEQMKLIKEKTGIRGVYVIGFLVVAIILVYLNIFDSLITNLVGTLYPAFWTMKSLEEKNDEDSKMWLTYWVVFGCFTLIDMFSFIIVKFLPFYFVLKIIFLIWLFMPNSWGCYIIYNLLVKRIFRYFESNIEEFSEKTVKNIADGIGMSSYNTHNKQKKLKKKV